MSGIMLATLGNFRSAAGGGTLLYNLDASALGARLGSSITTSASFNGTSQYLAGTNALFTFAGDFTVEGWYYPTTSVQQTLFCLGAANTTNRWQVDLVGLSVTSNLFGSSTVTYTSTVNINIWTHIAVVRSGSTVSVYINGTASPTTDTQAGTLGNGNGLSIGVNVTGSYFAGNISNFRIVNSAVYTGNFTTPTTTLRAVPGTVLLLPLTASPFMDLSANLITVGGVPAPAATALAPSLTTGTTDVTGTYTISYNLPVATFTGSISGTTLTVSGVTGTITRGMTVTGSSVPAGTCITSGSGSTWYLNASVVVSSTSMEASLINWFGTQGGVFSSLNTSVYSNDAYITGGPTILANTSYTVMMAYQLTIGSTGSSGGRLLNSFGLSGNPGGWVMGGANGRYAVWYSDPYGNIYGSGTDTVWHIDFVTYNQTSRIGNVFSSTSSQPTETPTQSFSTFSDQGAIEFRLFSRGSPSGDEPCSGNIGMVKVWNGVLTTAQMQTEYAAYKARFGY